MSFSHFCVWPTRKGNLTEQDWLFGYFDAKVKPVTHLCHIFQGLFFKILICWKVKNQPNHGSQVSGKLKLLIGISGQMDQEQFVRFKICRRRFIIFLWASQALKKLDLLKTPHIGRGVTLHLITFFHKNFFWCTGQHMDSRGFTEKNPYHVMPILYKQLT